MEMITITGRCLGADEPMEQVRVTVVETPKTIHDLDEIKELTCYRRWIVSIREMTNDEPIVV
jgi:hypothetical protein